MTLYRQITVGPNVIKYEHVAIAEKALGRALPKGAEVHHVNEDRYDNSRSNLVICQDHGYHRLLHVRARVVRRGGNPNTDKLCPRCDSVKHVSLFHRAKSAYCKPCESDWKRRRYKTQGKPRLRRPFLDGTLPPLPPDPKQPWRRSKSAKQIAALYQPPEGEQ